MNEIRTKAIDKLRNESAKGGFDKYGNAMKDAVLTARGGRECGREASGGDRENV